MQPIGGVIVIRTVAPSGIASIARPVVHSGPDELWTVDEAARFLKVPKGTLYRWKYMATGPPAHRVGKYLRYDPAEVRRWVAAS